MTSRDSNAPARSAQPAADAAVAAVADLIRDVVALKRDLQRSLHCDVSLGALSVLGQLDRCGPMRVGAVADRICADLSVASRHSTALEQRGLVMRSPAPDDPRVHELSVTDEGQALLDEVRAGGISRLQRALSGWPESDLRELSRLLAQLRADTSAASADADVGQPALA
jgi:DNA-binding MarR family transcriptional regulator